MKNHNAPSSHWMGLTGLAAFIYSLTPSMPVKKAKSAAKLASSKLFKISRTWSTPHYGKQAAARNRRHAENDTHGLMMDGDGHIFFGVKMY